MRKLFAALLILVPTTASAKTIIKDPNPPKYGVEIEPKLNFSYFGLYAYGGNAWGPGVRFSIPVMSPGFVKKINDSVTITFGADFMRYEGYYYYWCKPKDCPRIYEPGYDASFWSVHLPVALQWNFFITDHFSVFGEPGLTIRHNFFRDSTYCGAYGYCGRTTEPYFTLFLGGRWHFSDNLALTFRIGHPIDSSIGLSIFL